MIRQALLLVILAVGIGVWSDVRLVDLPEMRGEQLGQGRTLLEVRGETVDAPLAGIDVPLSWPLVESTVSIAAVGGEVDEYHSRDGAPRGESSCLEADWKLAALEAYGVEWAYDKLLMVEHCESTCRYSPCVIGGHLERGPLQFHPGTWAQQDSEGRHWNPYWQEDACDPLTAWQAAGAFIALGRQGEWSCWR